MARWSKCPPELRQRAVRLVIESRDEREIWFAAIESVACKWGITSPEMLRKWLRQAEIDRGVRSGVISQESAELKRLKRENAELRRASEILKAASAFFAAEFDRPGGF